MTRMLGKDPSPFALTSKEKGKKKFYFVSVLPSHEPKETVVLFSMSAR